MSSGLGVSGRLLTGVIQTGEKLRVLPGDESAVIRSTYNILRPPRVGTELSVLRQQLEIEIEEDTVPWAAAGANVTLYVSGIDRIHIG